MSDGAKTPHQQRRNDVRASNALLAGLGICALLGVVRLYLFKALNAPFALYAEVLLTLLLMAALYYAVRFGMRWIRILVVVFVSCTLVAELQVASTDLLNALSCVVDYIMSIWALVLLFQQPRRQAMN